MPTNAEIISVIFSTADQKFGLRLFPQTEINRLTFSQGGDKTLMFCPVSGKKKVAKPEEVVRQLMIEGHVARVALHEPMHGREFVKGLETDHARQFGRGGRPNTDRG